MRPAVARFRSGRSSPGGRSSSARRAAANRFAAINHKIYELEPGMCVIADAERAVALGGVMGGAESEVSAGTTDLLIESAEFDPLSIRNTARRVESAQRFVVPLRARRRSRRSRLGQPPRVRADSGTGRRRVGRGRDRRRPTARRARQPIVLRFDQLQRILGIEIVPAGSAADPRGAGQSRTAGRRGDGRSRSAQLAARSDARDRSGRRSRPDSWLRRDSRRRQRADGLVASGGRSDRVLAEVREALVAAGFDEAMTLSVVEPAISEAFSPWTDAAAAGAVDADSRAGPIACGGA